MTDLTCPRCLTSNSVDAERCRRCDVALDMARQLVAPPRPAGPTTERGGGTAAALAVTAVEPAAAAAATLRTAATATPPRPQPAPHAATPSTLGWSTVQEPPGSTRTLAEARAAAAAEERADAVYRAEAPFATRPDSTLPATPARSTGPAGWAVRESPRAAAQRETAEQAAAAGTAAPAVAVAEAPVGLPAGYRPAYATASAARSRPKHSVVAGIGGLGLAIVTRVGARYMILALLGLAGIGFYSQHYLHSSNTGVHAISLPTTVASEPQVKGYGAVDAAIALYNRTVGGQKDVKQVLSAVYGKVDEAQTHLSDAYELHLILVTNSGITTDQVLNALAKDNPAVTVDREGTVTKTINGTDFQCTPINDPSAPGATDVACLWNDGDVVGVLWAYDAANNDLVAATAAHVEQTAETRIG